MNRPLAKSSPRTGSRLTPEEQYVLTFVDSLKRDCIQRIKEQQTSICVAHNAMALYTYMMMAFATAHRAVSDPFHDISTFNPSTNTVLIQDKVVSSAHQTRQVWIPPLALSQFDNYVSHLRSVSRLLKSKNPVLADRIWAITEAHYNHPIPFFFWLALDDGSVEWSRVQPASLTAILADKWFLPLNTNRHMLSTWLRENGCHAEIIDAQLGHIDAGCAPFSRRSALSPKSVGEILTPLLQRYLGEQGWEPVTGIAAPSRYPVVPPHYKSKNLVPEKPIGPEARTRDRQNNLRKDSEDVLTLLKGTLYQNRSNPIPDDAVDGVVSQLMSESQPSRLLVRLTLLRRHLLKLRRSGIQVKVPGRLALGVRELSPFNLDSASAAAELEQVKDRFLTYLSSQAGTQAAREWRIAEIMVSASIFSAQTAPSFHDNLADCLTSGLFNQSGLPVVDIAASPGSPIRRWFPDCVSAALIVGYQKSLMVSSGCPALEQVETCLADVLQAIGVDAPKQKVRKGGPAVPISRRLAKLHDLCRAGWRYKLPGAVRAYAEGENSCASIPLGNWLRLVNNEPGTLEVKRDVEQPAMPDEGMPLAGKPASETDYTHAKLAWESIRRALPSTSKKGSESESRSDRSNAKKQKIESAISGFLNNEETSAPAVAKLVAQWVLYLCRKGTPHRPQLRASSIATYARTIGERLIAFGYDVDFLSIPDSVIEDIYRQVLDASPAANRGYVAGRLKEFHSFLIGAYGMPVLDWSEVIDDDLLEADAVDAGIVALQEYINALSLLTSDDEYSERDKLRFFSFLFFAYRFGLRTGEVARLAVSDVVWDGDQMVVYIRNSYRGETKSDSGVRQLPLVGHLCPDEKQMLGRWLAHIETFADDDPLATLLPQLAGHRDLLDRGACVAGTVALLRKATGDQQIRIRHLRHTCASRLYLAMMLEAVPEGTLGAIYRSMWGDVVPDFVREQLVGDPHVSRRGLYAVALYMGHASPDVTHRHYIHVADAVLQKWVAESDVAVHDKVLAYAFQTTYANIRQLRARHQDDVRQLDFVKHFMRQANIITPKLVTAERAPAKVAELATTNHSLSPADVDRLLSLATLRDSIDGLADRFLTSVDVVGKALLAAARVQEQTGFTDFAVPASEPDDYWLSRRGARYRKLEKEAKRVREFLASITRAPVSTEMLQELSGAWVSSYHPHSTHLLVSRRSELSGILDPLGLLAIPASDFEALLPQNENDDGETWESAATWLRSRGLAIRQKDRLPLSFSKYRPDCRIGLMLRASSAHRLGYQRSLNRALFIVRVWLELR